MTALVPAYVDASTTSVITHGLRICALRRVRQHTAVGASDRSVNAEAESARDLAAAYRRHARATLSIRVPRHRGSRSIRDWADRRGHEADRDRDGRPEIACPRIRAR